MTTVDNNWGKIASGVRRYRLVGEVLHGWLGDGEGNVIPPERPNHRYVRVERPGGLTVGVFRGTIRAIEGYPVIIATDPLSKEQVIMGADFDAAEVAGVEVLTLEKHANSHNWSATADDRLDWLHPQQFGFLRVQPATASQQVIIQPGAYCVQGKLVWKATMDVLDLSPYYPESGTIRVLVSIDVNGDYTVTEMENFPGEPGAIESGKFALSLVTLTAGAELNNLTDFFPLWLINQFDSSVLNGGSVIINDSGLILDMDEGIPYPDESGQWAGIVGRKVDDKDFIGTLGFFDTDVYGFGLLDEGSDRKDTVLLWGDNAADKLRIYRWQWGTDTLTLLLEMDISGNLTPAAGATFDGVDVSAHAADADAHHAAFTADDHAAIGEDAPHHIRYADSEAVSAMGIMDDSNPLHHEKYTDGNAVDAMGLRNDTNPLNHDRYTNSEAVAAMGTLGDTNPLHHDRYADSEAVSAMGTLGDTNPLNHDRYTDDEAESVVDARIATLGELLFTAADGLLLLGPGCPQYPSGWASLRGQIATITGAFHQVAGRWSETRALTVEVGTTNLVTNPSFETSATALYNLTLNGGTITQSTDALFGKYSTKLTSSGGGVVQMRQYNSQVCAPGDTYTVAVYAKTDGSGVQARLRIFDSTNVTYATTSTVSTEWTRLRVSYTNSTGSNATIVFYLENNGGSAAGEWVQFDGAQFEQSAYATSYCDGSLGSGYSWSGAPHASTSTRANTLLALADYVDSLNDNNTVSFSVWAQVPYDADAMWSRGLSYNYVFDMFDGTASNRVALAYDETDDKWSCYINGGERIQSSVQTFSTGDWVHLVLTFDFTEDEYHLYVNGSIDGSSTATLSAPTGMHVWYLGSSATPNYQSGCAYSEYAIFDRVLTAEEIAALYASGKPLADGGALIAPANNNGPLAASWPILYGSQTHTGNTTYTEAGSNQESRFGWGTWVSGKLQFEAVLKISDASDTAYAMLQWDDSGTWRDVLDSEVSLTGTTSADLVRSPVIYLSPAEREYRVVIKTSDSAQTVTIYKAVLICTPGGLDEI